MSEKKMKLFQCYNKGCSQQYEEEKNHSEACLFHPGEPFFHDAYKGWSCCMKKCTDFTEFLNMKGCKRSYHSNIKPAEPEKPKFDKSEQHEIIVHEVPKQPEALSRPNQDLPMKQLQVVIAPSLQQLLDKETEMPLVKDHSLETSTLEKTDLKIGTPCKNRGCKSIYDGEISDMTICTYHPGVPVFHEGLKYWSCCQRKTTEFNHFLEQEGCTNGSHLWIKKLEESQKKISCRYDWHQTGSFVFVSVYAKGANPRLSSVKANPVKLHLAITFGNGGIFDIEFILHGIIDVESSLVTMSATKIEVKLKKAEVLKWDKLSLHVEKTIDNAKNDEMNTSCIETISLDDIDIVSNS